MASRLYLRVLLVVIALTCGTSGVYAAPPFVLIDQVQLAQLNDQVKSNQLNTAQQALINALIERADTLLDDDNPTVMSKSLLPPTNDKHDYLSISRYWWPNPETQDGLPWIRKDGQTNPDTQTDAVDRKSLGRMTKGVKLLALAYFFSGDEKYAQKATAMVQTWFINDATRMNPHLSYAQSVPGNPKSRRSGILDGRLIPEHVLDAISLITPSPHWQDSDQQALNQWLTAYLRWLTDSKVGKQGALQTNNHGSWYNFQIAALSYYLGHNNTLTAVVAKTKQSLDQQFDEQGAQAHEIKRTRSFFYSTFNLRALVSVAIVADKAGLPFWHYQTEAGRSLQLGIDYLTPVAKGKTWPHPAKAVKLSDLAIVLSELAQYYPQTDYANLLKSMAEEGPTKLKWSDLKAPLIRHPELILTVN
ncbi:alginate lyase family protein [Neiella marina]|uniref:Alginate lyase family protein n=1 Tax=Neiella holothuriorum TaxID=2870530 RepID=A0ABS7EHI4_9GAMM|nr:alginate lyase family protein [Neiella holothuriorum]MBW8191137.1 alginate lyase family protein [Neiella holothuriorum]